MHPVFATCGTSVFEEMSRLSATHGAINLGQGFPVGMEPPGVVEAAVRALGEVSHQYPPMMGVPALRQAVAEANRRFWGLEVDGETEVLITSGATEALADCFLALINPGDEVIVFQPAYDSYGVAIRRAGGVPVPIRLDPPNWDLPRQQILDAITPRTRLIVVNSPMNPIGKVFDRDELGFLADLLDRHDLIAVCDEVYEHITFDDVVHVPLMTFPQARERCLRIGSAGKTFSVTGWKVGYVTAASALLGPVARAHQFLTFTTPPMLQSAVAFGLRLGDDYFDGLKATLRRRRDVLATGLQRLGAEVLTCDGTYFLCVGIASLGGGGDDHDLCRRLTVEAGVATIPLSSFYEGGAVRSHLRFCFAKETDELERAVSRIESWLGPRKRRAI
ncbi:aminotransferase [Magnetospirillum molischianum]|uniref:aspartate transaminase n=1 Tax=Magnetospirillum molischianum DSM 120 TaxID=1150626 RepID=H8FV22_MAGML|nr:aminotransferase [Magnetospirillum molischianum]CCG42210.1 Aminotransferase [Magnetospirillum molischianum DSM 120]